MRTDLKSIMGTSLVVPWLGFNTPNLCWIPGQGTRSHMRAATKSSHTATRSPHAATKDPACRS